MGMINHIHWLLEAVCPLKQNILAHATLCHLYLKPQQRLEGQVEGNKMQQPYGGRVLSEQQN